MIPPVAKKIPRDSEVHGRKFVDNYYWLRNKDTDDVIKYLEDENNYTLEMTARTKEFQEALFQEMKDRINEADVTVPIRYGDYFYYARNEKGKNYKIHCRKLGSVDADEEIILDENALGESKKYINVGCMRIDKKQNLLAYTVDFTGGETYDLEVLDLTTREVIDRLTGVASRFEWDSAGTTLFYTELDDIHRVYAVSRHILGTDQSDDVRIIAEEDKTFSLHLGKTNDESHLLIYIANMSDESVELHTLDLARVDGKPRLFFPRAMKRELLVEHHDGFFYIVSNHEDPLQYRLYRTEASKADTKSWEQVSDRVYDARFPELFAFQNYLVIHARLDGYASLSVFNINSGSTVDIDMPEPIYSINLENYTFSDIFYFGNPEFNTDLFRFYFSSPITPKSVYEYNMQSRVLTLLKVEEIKNHNPADYVTERLYASAKDGTKIPISLAYPRNLEKSEKVPLLLYGYGSYGISSDPNFNDRNLCLLERGMILAYAHVRGGGEYGKSWYHQGKLSHKMNTFRDFITCAEYLVDQNYTTPEMLCAWGGSAGGLLMGAIANLRPDLFKCILARVPFVDVINTMLDDSIPLTTSEYKEWGNPNIEKEFEWIIEYSPYDNVEHKDYPEMLITAGYNDPRVPYWEPAKWTAKLRALKTDSNKLLLKTKMGTGHFSSSGRYDAMKDYAFNWAFILDVLGLSEL